jgi:hypothetical protein
MEANPQMKRFILVKPDNTPIIEKQANLTDAEIRLFTALIDIVQKYELSQKAVNKIVAYAKRQREIAKPSM